MKKIYLELTIDDGTYDDIDDEITVRDFLGIHKGLRILEKPPALPEPCKSACPNCGNGHPVYACEDCGKQWPVPDMPEPMRDEPEGWREKNIIIWVCLLHLNRVADFVWTQDRKQIDFLSAGLCHTTRDAAQQWLDWWNEAVGRTA